MSNFRSQQAQLIEILDDILKDVNPSISEYELIQILQQPPYQVFEENALRDPLALFQCHFVLFNGLYQLQKRWLDNRCGLLDIVGTTINIHTAIEPKAALTTDDPLRDYYLDWSNLTDTTITDIEQLLDGFWHKMAGQTQSISSNDKQKALSVLAVASDYCLADIKAQYRRMQHIHHPDKGGKLEAAQQIEWAYQVLKKSLNS